MSTARFYTDLPTAALPLTDLLQESHFAPVPDDWHVVIADIQNSTAAVLSGRHDQVNLIAVGALVAALNVVRAKSLEVPFFFGGDGGALLIPQDILAPVLNALRRHNDNVQQTFGLRFHLGAVSVAAIRAAGKSLALSKYRQSDGLAKAALVGDGLQWAENQIKTHPQQVQDDTVNLDMTGLECRWDRIQPPASKMEVVCYLIQACRQDRQLPVYRSALQVADRIFGGPDHRNPLSVNRLKLQIGFRKMRQEMLARWGRWKPWYLISELVKTALGGLAFKYKLKIADMDGEKYLNEVITNADTLTIDGRINTIIAGTAEQHRQFRDYLDACEAGGELVYGHFTNRASIMTCYIEARAEKHVHFVDGSDGGYTAAAQELKGKLKLAA